jgi:ATP-dependent Lon protease
MKQNGMVKNEITIDDDQLLSIVRHYTKEAGVRSLEREIAKLCRRVIKENMLNNNEASTAIDNVTLSQHLGVKKFSYGLAEKENEVGQVTGLAWTSVGGELLTLEAAKSKGKGLIVKTGSLGDVMQESIQAALTVVKNRAQQFGVSESFFSENDIHIHVPEGATPKDGPSAGIGMAIALISIITNTPVNASVAMTGEITLRGKILPIGGLKEKLLAAHRGGIKTVIIPSENEKDLVDIPDNIKGDLIITPVSWIDEALDIALDGLKRNKN